MSRNLESQNQIQNTPETGDTLVDKATALENGKKKLISAENNELNGICKKYPQLPADPTQVPNVKEAEAECTKLVEANEEELERSTSLFSNKFEKLEGQLTYNENLNAGNQGSLQEVKTISITDTLAGRVPKGESMNGHVPENRETGFLDIA